MYLKFLTTAIMLNTMILAVPHPSYSQVVLNEPLLTEELETKSWSNFKLKLGQRETGESNPPYNIENSLGFIGKYQFGEALLIDLGYYQAEIFYNGGENGVDRNEWEGTWTGKEGINSKEDFLNNNNNVQETAIDEAFDLLWLRITNEIPLEDYLGDSIQGVPITISGILAAAHLRGADGVINLLRDGHVTHDEYNTSILEYLDEFQGYETYYFLDGK